MPAEITDRHIEIAGLVAARYGRRMRDRRHGDVDDLTQDACLALVAQRNRHPGDPLSEPLVQHIAAMACQAAIDRRVRSDSCEAAALLRASDRDKRPTVDHDDRLDLEIALDSIPPRQAAVMRLRYLQGETDADAARRLGVPYHAVTIDARLAKARLRELLGETYREAWSRVVPLRNPRAWKHQARRLNSKGGKSANKATNTRRAAIAKQLAVIASANAVRDDLYQS